MIILSCLCWQSLNWNWDAISAVATAIMAWLTYRSLLQNKHQLQKMQEQWEEEARPLLDIQMIRAPYQKYQNSVAIEIRNIGKSIARDIEVRIRFERPDEVKVNALIRNCSILSSKKLRIVPGESTVLPLCIIEDSAAIHNEKRYRVFDDIIDQNLFIHITDLLHKNKTIVDCTYNNKYHEHEELSMQNLGFVHYTTERELNNIGWRLSCIESKINS